MAQFPKLPAIILIGGLSLVFIIVDKAMIMTYLKSYSVGNYAKKQHASEPRFKSWQETRIKNFQSDKIRSYTVKNDSLPSTISVKNNKNVLLNTHEEIHTGHKVLGNFQDLTVENQSMKKAQQHSESLAEVNNNTLLHEYTDLRNEESQSVKSISKDQISKRYLLPIVIYGHQGPNSIYHSYRFAINYALNQNRSIVQIPFRSKAGGAMKRFNDTFDTAKLSELLPVKSLDDFRRDCGGSDLPFESLVNLQCGKISKALLQGSSRNKGCAPYTRNKAELHEDLLGIHLPILPGSGHYNLESELHYYTSVDVPCIVVSLIDSRRSLQDVQDAKDNYKTIDKYLIRAPYIRELGKKVVKKLCNGEDIAHLHWRNMASEGCPRQGECVAMTLLAENMHKLAQVIYEFLQARSIKCIYVSTPGTAQMLHVNLISTSLKVFNRNYLQAELSELSADFNVFKADPYKMSLLEQEIAVGAKLFIRCRWSTWSDFVLFARDVQKKETVDFTDIPGIPENLLKVNRLIKKK